MAYVIKKKIKTIITARRPCRIVDNTVLINVIQSSNVYLIILFDYFRGILRQPKKLNRCETSEDVSHGFMKFDAAIGQEKNTSFFNVNVGYKK